MPQKYAFSNLLKFGTALFEAAGLSHERACTMASVLLEADLLGFSTHGMHRVPHNLGWLLDGTSRLEGEPEVLAETSNLFNWDANFLPGPWVVNQAIQQCIDKVANAGIVSATIRRSQHIACLGAYCPVIAEAGYLALITCSSPNENNVCAHGGIEPLFSANPLAFVAPAAGYPVLFDISMCITAGGYVTRALREGKPLPGKFIKDNAGNITDDPAAFYAEPPGSILPIGGESHGYKGYALTMMTEILSTALGGYGRADDSAATDGEANSVFIQMINPAAFGAKQDYLRQIQAIKALSENSKHKAGDEAVRVPGQRAWQRRQSQMEQGVELYPSIMQDLEPWAERLGVEMPVSTKPSDPST
ncbi:MAG: Ldh family oxidoreductase [Gammaproteobacteria bacterium]|nr:Ldh family oxidoreductase [Gammaproteobacteria bacterium]